MIRRVAVTLTVLGLIADWAYMHFYVATLFMGIGEWGFGLWWAAMGGIYIWWLATAGWHRIKAVLAQTEQASQRSPTTARNTSPGRSTSRASTITAEET